MKNILIALSLSLAAFAQVAPTNEPPKLTVVSDTADLDTDGPLSHFRLYGVLKTNRVVIKQILIVETTVTSNTLTHIYSHNGTGWVTNSGIESMIPTITLSKETNTVERTQ